MIRILFFGVVILATSHGARAQPDQLQMIREQASPGIARIFAYTNEGVARGTGFLISQHGEIVTAYHVIYGATRIEVVLSEQRYDRVVVSRVRPDSDVAVLKVSDAVGGRSLTLAPPNWSGRSGESVYALGHPRGFIKVQLLAGRLTQDGFIPTEEWFDDKGKNIFAVRGVKLLAIDINTEDGLSGAPVINQQAQVVGILSGSIRRGGAYSWAVSSVALDQFRLSDIDKPAGDLKGHWPVFSFIVGGADSLRRFVIPGSEVARFLEACRGKIETYREASSAVMATALSSANEEQEIEPLLQSTEASLNEQNAREKLAIIDLIRAKLEPSWQKLHDKATDQSDAWSNLAVACYVNAGSIVRSFSRLAQGQANSTATRDILDRGKALSDSFSGIAEKSRVFSNQLDEKMREAMQAMAQNRDTPYRRASASIKIIRYFSEVGELSRSADVAKSFEDAASVSEEFASIIEGVELLRIRAGD
jgi:S1-C subfamily serine protease